MLKNIKKSIKLLVVSALMLTTLCGGALAQAAGPGGPGNQGRPGNQPRMEQRMDNGPRDNGHREAPPPRHRDRDNYNDNSTAELALGIAAITAAVVIANS
jgi:hypothetical protein